MDKHFELDTINMLAATIVDDTIKGAKAGTEKAVMIQTAAYKLAGHIRKPSDDDKSVPARCEEAYNEALLLLAEATDIITKIKEFEEPRTWLDKRLLFLKKPNPFKEADIVHEDETEPTKIPFSLELAAQGHKVVTRDGREAKIVAEGLNGDTPVLVVVTNEDGTKHAYTVSREGYLSHHSKTNNPADLFILKEPETVEVRLYRHEKGKIHAIANNFIENGKFELIKTIKVTV